LPDSLWSGWPFEHTDEERRSVTPCSEAQRARPRAMRPGARGSRSAAVPTPTSVAPARRYCTASSTLETPPSPMIGTFGNARDTRHVASSPIGNSAGPLTPPVPKPIFGRRRAVSMTSPGIVLTSVSPSAPESTATCAAATMPAPSDGDSFTNSGRRVHWRAARTSAASATGSAPNSSPPDFTFGQLTLSSNASTPALASRPATTVENSSTLLPTTLTSTRSAGSRAASHGMASR